MHGLITKLACFGVLLACLGQSGCLSLDIGVDAEPPQLNARGLVNGHFTATGLEEYDGRILKAGLFGDSARPGEIASLDIWPIGGVGAGLIGGRIRVLPLEMGLGVLSYDPKPVVQEDEEDVEELGDSEREPAQP